MPLRLAFAGTPEFAVPSLRVLLAKQDCDVVAVYTQPDRPAGRGRKARPSAVKTLAVDAEVEVRQPESFRDDNVQREFFELELDVFVVAAYGLLLPQAVLDAVAYPINVHASLLPRWRGAAPIQRAIMAGDDTTGITIMRLVAALDAGPIWLQRSLQIGVNECAGELHDRLAALGAECLAEALTQIDQHAVEEREQDDNLAVYAPKIDNDERRLDFSKSAESLQRIVRALNPTPVALATFAGEDCKVWRARADAGAATAPPGTVISADPEGIRIATADGILTILQIQAPGKRPLDVGAFMNGYGAKLFGSNRTAQ